MTDLVPAGPGVAPEAGVCAREQDTACCMVGGGPGGMVTALLLARQGVEVTLLESRLRWAEREFRGNTLNPAALSILAGAGLAQGLEDLPHAKARRYKAKDGAGELVFADFARLGGTYQYVMMLPQASLLRLVAEEVSRYPNFRLVMGASVRELVEEGGAVRGVRYAKGGELREVRAPLVVGADGRFSTVRRLSGLDPGDGSPIMHVLWWKLPRDPSDSADAGMIFRLGHGVLLALMDHFDHWQVGYIVGRGAHERVRAEGLATLREKVAGLAPEIADRDREIPRSWADVSLLPVVSDRLRRWHRPGLLLIGDAAHAASPIGGVGINLAIQDAAVAAEELAGPLLSGVIEERHLARVQRRREPAVKLVQAAQDLCQRWIVSDILDAASGPYALPRWVRAWYRVPVLRDVPTRLIAYGAWHRPRPERRKA